MAFDPEDARQRRKLGVRDGCRVATHRAPEGWRFTPAPDGLEVLDGDGDVDLVFAFFTSASQLVAEVSDLAPRIFPDGALWIAWPRRAGGHDSDLTDVIVRNEALRHGIVDVKVAALDNDWSGLRFVWRRSHRATPPTP